MKLNRLSLISIACIAFSPTARAVLGTSCIGAMKSMSQVPGLFFMHMQSETCPTGCRPVSNHWNSDVKDKCVHGIVEDASHYVGASDDTDAKEAFVNFLNQIFENIRPKCEDKLENKHICQDPAIQRAMLDCINKHSWSAVATNVGGMIPYMSEDRCKKAGEYMTSDTLWKEDFPGHIRPYVNQCHEL